jgi:hypothetical protein
MSWNLNIILSSETKFIVIHAIYIFIEIDNQVRKRNNLPETRLIGTLGHIIKLDNVRGRKKVNLDCRYQANFIEKVLGYIKELYIRNFSSLEERNNWELLTFHLKLLLNFSN